MSFEPSGDLTTDERQVVGSTSWDTQAEWEAYQSLNNLQIENGVVKLASAIPDSVVYDFETGDVSRWDEVNDLSAVSDRVNSGSFAGYSDNNQSGTFQARSIPEGYDGGAEPSSFEFFCQENSSNNGGGIRLLNSSGNPEIGLGLNNPQWTIDDGNGIVIDNGGSSVGNWIRWDVQFDWANSAFDITIEDLNSGESFTDSGRPLKSGADIETVQIDQLSGDTWQGSNDIVMWFDDIGLFA